MDKLKKAMSGTISRILREFLERGGVAKLAGRVIQPEVMAAPGGIVPAFVWLAKTFYQDYSIEFPEITYHRDECALTGYTVEKIDIVGSNAPFLLMMTDFLRSEVFPDNVEEVDLDLLVGNFREWCDNNVLRESNDVVGQRVAPEGKPS